MPTRQQMQAGRLVWRVIYDETTHKPSGQSIARFMRARRSWLGKVAREMYRVLIDG